MMNTIEQLLAFKTMSLYDKAYMKNEKFLIMFGFLVFSKVDSYSSLSIT